MKSYLHIFLLTFLPFLISAQDARPKDFCGYQGKSTWLEKYQQNPDAYRTVNGKLYIPMTLHLVGDDNGVGYLNIHRALEAMCILNNDFAASDISFYLIRDINFIDNSDWYEHDFSGGRDMMRENNFDDCVNAYVVSDPAENCGYYNPGPDAVALAKSCMGLNDHTFAHEMGHLLSLPHPFLGWEGTDYPDVINTPDKIGGRSVEKVDGSNCHYAADGFCDTAPDYLSYRWSCDGAYQSNVVQTDPNGETFRSDGTLFMSYSNDNCAQRFSDEQIEAMRANATDERAHIVEMDAPGGLINPNDSIITISPAHEEVVEAGEVLFRWEAVEHATYYVFEIARLKTMQVLVHQEIISDNQISITDLQAGKNYYWRIRPFGYTSFCEHFSEIQSFETAESTVGLKDISSISQVTVFPNPARQSEEVSVNFISKESHQGRLIITDLQGLAQINENITIANGTNEFAIPSKGLSPGMYLLMIESIEGRLIKKFVIGN